MWSHNSFLLALFLLGDAEAFYLPGVNPQSFEDGKQVKLKVNKLTSSQALLPVEYYKLPFCTPEGGPQKDHENLGELLAGDRIESSPYRLKMKEEMFCEQLCVTDLGRAEQKGNSPNKIVRSIRKDYHHNWIVDNLPAASRAEDDKTITTRYWQGFPVGFLDEERRAYVNNHVNIEIMYHTVSPGNYRVVRFIVEPFSIKHEYEAIESDDDKTPVDADVEDKAHKVADIKKPIASCMEGAETHTTYDMVNGPGREHQVASGEVLFTYDVTWTEHDEIEWATRWDIYLNLDGAIPAKVHWMNISNSLVIVFVLSAMIAAIVVRNLRRDFSRYNKLATDEEKAEELEEFGWKLVHADVFRPPTAHPLLLAVFCGTGAQLLMMAFVTIIFSIMGFLSPSNRGALIMAQLILYVLMGCFAGYVTARFYKSFKGKNWNNATIATAVGYPSVCFAVFFILNLVAVFKKSTDAVPFYVMIILLFMWFGISTPLVFLGAYFGYKQDSIEFPTTTSSIARKIPEQPWFMGLPFTLAVGGILPFGACFVELYFILSSVWTDQYYYVFGFLFVVFLILVVTCAEITVLFTYFQLCGEDYHWWWRSFFTAGSFAIYVFLYSILYFKQLEANTLATYILYFGYMGLASLGLLMMTGFIGVLSSLVFNLTIFGSIKID
mmetsp:Transcript_14927/g.22713  ORF Transcript_14927/g.22713 Transcript_14927/m.22713 type:complete len:664 (+) Transcript_14927:46-2037(+)